MRTKADLGGCALLSNSVYERRKTQSLVDPEGRLGYRRRD